MNLEMNTSILIISKYDRFVEIKEFWDIKIREQVQNPHLYSCMLSELWKVAKTLGEKPLLIIFLLRNKIIGFAPLKIKSTFGFRKVSNLYKYIYPEVFENKYRKFCMDKMIDLLFNRFNCKSAEITFEEKSSNKKALENSCLRKGLYFKNCPMENSIDNKAIIPIKTNLDDFQKALGKNARSNLKKTVNKLGRLGSWQVHKEELHNSSIKKIYDIEKHSWKNNLTGKNKLIKDQGLACTIRGITKNNETNSFFKSKAWFLEINGIPASYQLVLKHKKIAYFIKTSFDSRFKQASPGKFLMKCVIDQLFQEQTTEEIDFITNIPLVNIWKPVVKKRVTVKIEQNQLLSRIQNIIFENPINSKVLIFYLQKICA
jgi:hypothetical protein